ncbi:MAG: M1 family metallopeptidase [Clostridiales bacterium]|nr:M1 family metallopeptidase [Clostridiales bacterium]
MKKNVKITALVLAASLIVPLAACSKKTKETRKKRKTKKTTKVEESETTKRSLVPTDTTTETTEEPSESSSDPRELQITIPDGNCAIEFPTTETFRYTMDLTLDTEKNQVGGHVEIELFNYTAATWEELCFRDYSSLFIDGTAAGYSSYTKTNGALTEINNITDSRSGKKIDYKRDDDVSVVWVPLSTPLAPQEKMTLSYDFVAQIPTVPDRYGVSNDVFNVTNFYPILAEYTDTGWSHEAFYNMGECFFSEISQYDVTLTAPENYMVLTTGTQTSATTEGGKTVYKLDAPNVRDFVFCASPNFEKIEGDYDGTHINVVYDKAHLASNQMEDCAKACLQASQDSLAAFNEAFGKYPYPELDVVLAPIDAGGMEYPNLVIITTDSFYCTSNSYEDIPFELISVVVAHEIGHQWFMGIVGSNSGLEPWLDESFASYTELVYYEYLGIDTDVSYYSRNMQDLTNPSEQNFLKSQDILPINRSYYSFSDSGPYVAAAYEYGKMALYQMEEILGREQFHGIIREYVRRNAFTNSTADRFFEVLFEAAGTDNALLNDLVSGCFEGII